jgi:hypothetical protein
MYVTLYLVFIGSGLRSVRKNTKQLTGDRSEDTEKVSTRKED